MVMSKKRQLAVPKVEVSITETALKNEVRDATTSTTGEVKSKQVERIAYVPSLHFHLLAT